MDSGDSDSGPLHSGSKYFTHRTISSAGHFFFSKFYLTSEVLTLADTIKTFFSHLVDSGLLCIVGDPWYRWSHILASISVRSLVVNLSFPSLGKES